MAKKNEGKVNQHKDYVKSMVPRLNVLGPAISPTAGKSTKNHGKSTTNGTIKRSSINTILNAVGSTRTNRTPSNLEMAYRRYEALASGRDFSEINSYYNKTGQSAMTKVNGRYVRDPKFTRNQDYQSYKRAPYRPKEPSKYNQDNWWGFGTKEEWLKGKKSPIFSPTNEWEEGTEQSNLWHEYHDYRDPNYERDEKLLANMSEKDAENWKKAHWTHDKRYANEQEFLKDKTKELINNEQYYFAKRDWYNNQSEEERQKYIADNTATHKSGRSILDRIIPMNNTAAQVAYAKVTGGDKSQAFKDSIYYMGPLSDYNSSDRKTWADVGEESSKEKYADIDKGGSITVSPTPLGNIRELKGESAKDYIHLSNALGGLVMDIATDPLSYVGGAGFEAVGKILKGTGNTKKELEAARLAMKELKADDVAKNVANASSKDIDYSYLEKDLFNTAKKVILDSDKTIVPDSKRHLEMTRDLVNGFARNIYGMRAANEGRGLGIGLKYIINPVEGSRLDRSKIINVLSKEIVSAEQLRKFGNKTVAPIFNLGSRKLRSTLLTAFSKNNEALKFSMKNGQLAGFNAEYGRLMKEGYGVADKGIHAGRHADSLEDILDNDTKREQFLQSHDRGDYRMYTEWKDVQDDINEKVASKIQGQKEDIAKKTQKVREARQARKEANDLLEQVKNNTETKLANQEYQNMSGVIKELKKRRKMLKLGGAEDAVKNIDSQIAMIRENKRLFNKYHKEVYTVFNKPITELSYEEALNAKFICEDLDLISQLSGRKVPWDELNIRYLDEMRAFDNGINPNLTEEAQQALKKPNIERFRKLINERVAQGGTVSRLSGDIEPVSFTQFVHRYKNELIDTKLAQMAETGKFDNVLQASLEEAREMPYFEQTLWNNYMYQDKGQFVRGVENIADKWYTLENGAIGGTLEGRFLEEAVDAGYAVREGAHLDEIIQYRDNLKELSQYMYGDKVPDAERIINYLDNVIAKKQFYDLDVIAKSFNEEVLTKAVAGLDKEASRLNKQLGRMTIDDYETLAFKEFQDASKLSTSEINRLLEFEGQANFEDILKAHELFAKDMASIAQEEVKIGKLSPKAAEKLKNQYVPREVSDEAKQMWEELFGEPFEVYLRNPGKYNPTQGAQMTKNQARTFKAMEDGERWWIQQNVRKQGKEFFDSHGLSYTDADLDKYVKANYKKYKDEFGKFYNYNLSEIFLNRAILHNDLVQSDAINNLVKARLTTPFTGKMEKDKLTVSYLDVMDVYREAIASDKKLSSLYDNAQLMFDDIMEKVGINPELVGKNISHFEVTPEQLKAIKEAAGKKSHKIVGLNMDNYIYKMLNRYTKAQMTIMQNSFLNVVDAITTKWKILNTIINPGFHGQNAPSNFIQTFFGMGLMAFDPVMMKKSVDIIRTGDPKQIIRLHGKDYTYREMRRIIKEYNVVDNTFFNDFARQATDNLNEVQMRDVTMEDFNNFIKNDFGGALSFLNPVANVLNKPFKLAGKVGAAIEGTQRINLFLHAVDEGQNFREAVQTVNKFLFDYGDLTDVEQQLFKRVIPFYSFLRKNVPMELEMMFRHPERFAGVRRTFDTISRMSEDYIPNDERNEYRDGDIQIPVPINGKYYALADNMPYTQFEKWADIGRAIGQTNPLLKAPLELYTGKYAYTGMDIENLPSYIANQIPAGKITDRYLHDKHFGIMPYEADEDYEPDVTRGALWGLGQTIGFPINPLERTTYRTDSPVGDYWEDYENEPNILQELLAKIKKENGENPDK